ncbi:hypothetical protein ACFQE8_17245 [Salinirubellus sp. GCM10025818]|uniref:hypothetical protein n=1 Tax=Salinirubellus TaxID=2162630 RepID=UPI0030CAB8A1
MSTETQESTAMSWTPTRLWGSAIAGGLVAGVGMGLIMHFVMGAMPLIGALVGQPTVLAGWILHMLISVVFALTFAAIVARTSFREYGLVGMIGLGAAYGIVLEIVAAGFVLPLWANAVGAGPLPVPFLVPMGFLTHIVFGVLLGAVFGYAVTRDRTASMAEKRTERPAA